MNFNNFLNTLSTKDFNNIISQRIFNSDEIKIARAAYFFTPAGYRYFMSLEDKKKKIQKFQK